MKTDVMKKITAMYLFPNSSHHTATDISEQQFLKKG